MPISSSAPQRPLFEHDPKSASTSSSVSVGTAATVFRALPPRAAPDDGPRFLGRRDLASDAARHVDDDLDELRVRARERPVGEVRVVLPADADVPAQSQIASDSSCHCVGGSITLTFQFTLSGRWRTMIQQRVGGRRRPGTTLPAEEERRPDRVVEQPLVADVLEVPVGARVEALDLGLDAVLLGRCAEASQARREDGARTSRWPAATGPAGRTRRGR